jgi:hypothetical protein
MIRSKFYSILCGFLVLLCTSCTKEKTETLVIDGIVISAEGPVFEGANTVQGEVTNRLNAFAREKGMDPADFHSAKLKKITLSIDDTADFDLFTSINIQFVSDKTDMVEAALVNKVQPGSRQLEPELSAKQHDLLDLLKQDKFTIVADANISGDSDNDIKFMGKIEIELKY